MTKSLAIFTAATVIATSTITLAVSPLNAYAMNATQYRHCLERIISKRGFDWAVNHAGATVCDKR